ncbi:MAG TPA: YciI family protein [Alphaproteobacteria bacterium]|nr:YciI family protein [Alphaproteobacteria bacterium]
MLFAIIAEDQPNAVERRQAVRPTHLAHLESLGDRLVLAGPFLDTQDRPTGSLVVIDAESREEAETIAARDPFVTEGVFARYEVRRWNWSLKNPGGR